MGRLIIDGKSVFELDEKCLKERKVPEGCDVHKYMENYKNDNRTEGNHPRFDKK